MCACVNEHKEFAREIRRLFEIRFGEFSSKDFKEVAKFLGFDVLPLKLGPPALSIMKSSQIRKGRISI